MAMIPKQQALSTWMNGPTLQPDAEGADEMAESSCQSHPDSFQGACE